MSTYGNLQEAKQRAAIRFPNARRIDADGSVPLVDLIMTSDPLPDNIHQINAEEPHGALFAVDLPAGQFSLLLIDRRDLSHLQAFYDSKVTRSLDLAAPTW